jgi:DNA-binding transcriptional LysR family regulator
MAIFDDLFLLRAFVSIVENGSISAAARSLRVAQPTLSRHLASLEEKCGVALLSRDTHMMSLTEAGHRLLSDAKAMLLLAEESEQRMRHEQLTLQGHIRVFATIDFGQSVVSRLIASFIQDNPAVTVELSLSNRALHMIQEGCDAGIIAGEITDDSVVARPIGKIARYPAASPALINGRNPSMTPDDLREWPWITLLGSHFGGSKDVTLHNARQETQTISVSPVMISEGITSIREATRAGLGVAVLPEWLAREDLVSGRLLRVLPDWHATPLPANVVYPGQRMLPARVRAFIDFAVTYMATILRDTGD